MIFGTGPIRIKLCDENDVVQATLDLARCSEREVEDYEDVILKLGTDADGNAVEEFQGVRFHARYVWRSHEHNQSEMAQVQRAANWRGLNKVLLLTPHLDWPHQTIRCVVAANPIKPMDGKVTAEEITLEIWGVDVLPTKPNPGYDLVCRWAGRGHVAA